MSRAQGLSIETIIVAALVMGLLIIVGTLLLRSGERVGKNTFTCEAQGGSCETSDAACLSHGGQPLNFACPTKEKPGCCKFA